MNLRMSYPYNTPYRFPKWGMTYFCSSHRIAFRMAMFVQLPFDWRLLWLGKNFIDGYIKGGARTL